MKQNENKIAFIICTNYELMFRECERYIQRLHVPDGFSIEIIPVRGARSMTSGYNQAMVSTDAKYKIYMHQDVFIINHFFLENILRIFQTYHSVGMIGMVGTNRLSSSGIMWKGKSGGGLYECEDRPYVHEILDDNTKILNAEAIDGLLMATCQNIPWREDLFDGFDFYDISQSFEFRRQRYDIAVPDQDYAWCVHDDGKILNLFNYNHYRKIFLENYAADMNAVERQ